MPLEADGAEETWKRLPRPFVTDSQSCLSAPQYYVYHVGKEKSSYLGKGIGKQLHKI